MSRVEAYTESSRKKNDVNTLRCLHKFTTRFNFRDTTWALGPVTDSGNQPAVTGSNVRVTLLHSLD